MEFHIKVRDFEFWSSEKVLQALSDALTWMTGDKCYTFDFQSGHTTEKAHLFDVEGAVDLTSDASVMLFSGGLDSLAGVAQTLEETDKGVCLVSHRSQPGTIRTQKALVEAIERRNKGRVVPYPFTCTLSGINAPEESQRSRAFLYCSIAFAVTSALKQNSFSVFENGITALNFPKRRDMINARSSRTVHPKTIALLERLFSLTNEAPFGIKTPFLFKTKAEIFEILRDSKCAHLINSSTSCSRTRSTPEGATHCGRCSQCIDRRFAAYASKTDNLDEAGIYAFDFIDESIDDGETKTVIVDFLRQAKEFAEDSVDRFEQRLTPELLDVVDYVNPGDPYQAIDDLYNLSKRHGNLVRRGILRMHEKHYDPYHDFPNDSLFRLINRGDHFRPPVELLAEKICRDLQNSLPLAFQKNLPRDENDLNDKIEAYLNKERERFEREHPAITFGLSKTKPDHASSTYDLWIEAKYIRKRTTPSKVSDGMAADITKYPEEVFKLFIVYDPTRSISDDGVFAEAFHRRALCRVEVIR